MGKLFSVISEQAANAPLVNYQTRIVSLFTTASWLSLVIFPLLMGAVVVRAIAPGTRPFSQEFGRLYRGYLLAARDILTETLFNRFFLLALAGIVLGLSMSIRVLGPAAGGIVGLYFLLKHGKKAVLPLVLYTVTSALVMYGTWPYLWLDPLPNFLSSLRAMSSFLFVRPVLFDGVVLSSRAIPSSYVPTLLALKFTEPFVILCLVGLVAALLMFVRREKFSEQTLFILTLLWFFFPFTYFVVARPGMYDNIRQILFITPPLGILAGFGFKWVLGKVKGTPFRVLLVGLVLLPNLYYLVSLHPYEYIYFNAFTGGVQGAYRQYELDYWGTSYKEAVEYLNQVAEKDALVAVFGPLLVARQYKREDLQFERGSRLSSLEEAGVDYVIMTTRENMDLEYALDGTVIYIVTRDGAVLAIVYKIE
jgi:hypothetical protein